MVRVSVEICSGAARFKASVLAESIERAVSLAKAHHPRCQVSLVFPIEPENFFVNSTTSVSDAGYLAEASKQDIGPASVD